MKVDFLNIRKQYAGKLNRILCKYKVKKLFLFGSYADGHHSKYSDIDFLVEFKTEADLFDQIGLKFELEELLGKKVDVVTPNSLSRYFRDEVIKEAIEI